MAPLDQSRRILTVQAKLAFGIVLITSLSGCVSTQRVTYSVEKVPRATNSPVTHLRLKIGPLRDVRQRVAGNEVLFNSPSETTIDNAAYCVNAEEGYAPNSVGTQISEALAQHLRHRGSFRDVSVGRPVADAFYLSGTLRRFYAAQKSTSISPTTGVLFGAIGVAVASAATPDETPGMVSIEIVDWVLCDNAGKFVARLPDVAFSKQLSLPAGSDCLVVYSNVNERPRQAFVEYAHIIEKAVDTAARGVKPTPSDSVQAVAQPAITPSTASMASPAAASAKHLELPPEEPW